MAGRPRQFNREEAVRLAVNEFWRHGFNDVSVKGLCEKMQITRSSFYHSFGNLNSLYEEALNFYLRSGPSRCFQDNSESSALEDIHKFFALLCKLRAADKEHRGCLVINSLTQMNGMDEQQKLNLTERINSSIAGFETLVRRASEQQEIKPPHSITTLAMSLQTLAIGLNTLSTVVYDEQQLRDIYLTSLNGIGLSLSPSQ